MILSSENVENKMTGSFTEQSIDTTLGTNSRNARICHGMKERSTYDTDRMNDSRSRPLSTLVEYKNSLLFSNENIYLVFEFNQYTK